MQIRRFAYFILGINVFSLACFSLFGLLSTGEPGNHIGWGIGYSLGLIILVPTAFYLLYMAFKRSDT